MNGWWWNWYSGPACPARASFQPPAYQAQEIPFSDNRSPMVANVWFGTSDAAGTVEGCGAFTEKAVLTAWPSGVTNPSLTRAPLASSCATALAGAPGNVGVCAAISQKWLRNEPPNAAWKKLSHSV